MLLSASEVISALFRQKGVPSLDAFTTTLIKAFRKSIGFDPAVDGPERNFISLTRWRVGRVGYVDGGGLRVLDVQRELDLV